MLQKIQKKLSWVVNPSIEGQKNMAFAQGNYVDSTVASVFVCSKRESHIHLYLNKAKRPKKYLFLFNLTGYFFQVLVHCTKVFGGLVDPCKLKIKT